MKNYERPVAEVLLFRLDEVRMIPRFSKTDGNDSRSGNGDRNGDIDQG